MSDRQPHLQRDSNGRMSSNNRSGNPTFQSTSAKHPIRNRILKDATVHSAPSEHSGTFEALLAFPASRPGELPSFRLNAQLFEALHLTRTVPHRASTVVLENPRIPAGSSAAGRHPAGNGGPIAGDEPDRQLRSHYTGIYFFPMNRATLTSHGLLCVVHRYISRRLLRPCTIIGGQYPVDRMWKKVAVYGLCVAEIKKDCSGSWRVIPGRYSRRITERTPVDIAGPARGSGLLSTKYSPDGTRTRGIFVDCAYSFTPWRTYLVCEKNWAFYFANRTGRSREQARYGISTESSRKGWVENDRNAPEHVRFDASAWGNDAKEDYRNEPNCHGWILEIDPFNPESMPKKRTAMGRLAHACAWLAPVKEGHPLVWYLSDDDPNEYIYKFVTKTRFHRRTACGDMLDEGTLYAARFNEDGTGDWLALDLGEPSFRAAAAARHAVFRNQAEVLVNTRLAADVVGATAMNRPQWKSVYPQACEIYLSTTDSRAGMAQAAHPPAVRAPEPCGHIVRWSEQDRRSFATKFTWDLVSIAEEDENPVQFSGSGPEHLPNRRASPA